MDRAASAIWSIIRAVDVLQDLAGTEYTSMSSAAPPLEPVLLEVEEEEAPPRLHRLPAEPLRERLVEVGVDELLYLALGQRDELVRVLPENSQNWARMAT